MFLGNRKRLYLGIGIALAFLSLAGCSSSPQLHSRRLLYEGPGYITFENSPSPRFFELITGDLKAGKFQLVEMSSLKTVLELPMDNASSAWSFDGGYVARFQFAGASTTVVYDTVNMKSMATWQGYWVDKWAADGPQLLLGHARQPFDPLWWLDDATNPERLQPLSWAHRPQTHILWFSAKKGRAIYLNDREELVEGDLSTGVGKTLITSVHSAIVSPNGEAVAVSRGKAGLALVDVQSGNSFDVPDSVIDSSLLQNGSWSPDSQRFAVLKDLPCRLLAVDRQKRVATWAPEEDCTVNHAVYPTATYWSHDSRYVFLGYEHRIATVRSQVGVFDFATGQGKSYTIGDQELDWVPDGTGLIAKIGQNPGRVEEYRLPPAK